MCAKLSIRGPRSNVRFFDLVAQNRTVANSPNPVILAVPLGGLKAELPKAC